MSKKRLSIIIPARNEEKTLREVLRSCQSLRPFEIIVVANGCVDRTVEIAKEHKNCNVLVYDKPLGHNVGRSIGAKEAKGDILLFLDADFALDPSSLRQFLAPLFEDKADVVLNNLDYIYFKHQRPHPTTVWRQTTNLFWRRPDLNIDSLVSVPHAMTKEALQKIGVECLKNPPLAHFRIIRQGLRIANDIEIDVISLNRFREEDHRSVGSDLSVSEKRIIGNHIEAMAEWFNETNDPRALFPDGNRKRDVFHKGRLNEQKYRPNVFHGWGMMSKIYGGKQLSVIIPVQNEEKTIGEVIKEARKIEPLEIIVVVNGSTDKTEEIAKKNGATVIAYKEALGNDTGRAVGAFYAQGDILLFIDGDFVIPAADLYPFARAIRDGVDLALNDLNHYLSYRFPLHVVTACKYAFNLACGRKDLGVGSVVAVPHAFSKKCVDGTGRDALISPVHSQARAILEGYKASNVHRVEVDKMNLIRPNNHFKKPGDLLPPSTTRIVGDHIEGIHTIIRLTTKRGLF